MPLSLSEDSRGIFTVREGDTPSFRPPCACGFRLQQFCQEGANIAAVRGPGRERQAPPSPFKTLLAVTPRAPLVRDQLKRRGRLAFNP